MRPMTRRFLHRLLPCRSFSTTHTYTGRVVRSDRTGTSLSVSIESPSHSLPRGPRGIPLPRHNLVCHIVNLLLRSSGDPYLSLPDFFSSLPSPPTSYEISLVLKSLNSLSKSHQFFKFVATLPGFVHDSCTYNRMLHILSRHGDEDASVAWDLINQMERDGVTGNISTINLLVGMVGANGVNRCMELVEKWGLSLNGYTYKCMVQAYIRGRDVKQGFRVYDEMRRKGYKLDIFAYNMLLHALAQAGMVCFLSFSFPF